MNYIQIELGGKSRGLKFNQIALETYIKHLKYEKEGAVASAIFSTFYAGLIGNCYVKNEEPDFDFETVTDWVQELFDTGKQKEIEQVCKLWEGTLCYQNWLKAFQEKLRTILEPGENKEKKKKK